MRVRALLGTRLTVASGIVLAVVTAAAVQGIGSWLPIEANLRHVEDPRSAPIVELRRKGEDGVLDVHIVIKPKFRNTGFKATTLESGIPELRLYHDVHVEHAVFTLSTEFHDWRRSWVLDVSEIRLDREPATDALNSRSRDHGKNDPRRNRQARSEQRPHAHSLPPGESALMPRPRSGSH